MSSPITRRPLLVAVIACLGLLRVLQGRRNARSVVLGEWDDDVQPDDLAG